MSQIGVSVAQDSITASPFSGGDDTEQVTLSGNLDAASIVSPGVDATSFASLSSSAQFSTSVDIHDSQQHSHTLSLFFFHLGTNNWSVRGYADGGEIIGGTAGSPQQLIAMTLSFTTGGASYPVFISAASGPIAWANGATGGPVIFAFSPVTQFYSRSRMMSFLLPEPTPTPTPTPSPTPSDCQALSSCLSAGIDTVMNTCQASATSCTQHSDAYVLTAAEIADRAISSQHCELHHSRAACRRCFAKARKLLGGGRNQALLQDVTVQAQMVVLDSMAATCK
jgi:hypothetical protein